MNLELLDRAYGPKYAGYTAVVVDSVVGAPVRLYASANGRATLSESGQYVLPATGRLYAYVKAGTDSGFTVRLHDFGGGLIRVDSAGDATNPLLETGTDNVSASPSSAQQDALSVAGGGGIVVVGADGVLYDPQGNPMAGGGGGSTPLIGSLVSTATTAALRADQGPAITALIGAKYTLPATGMPVTDLDAATQTAIAAAGTALQPAGLKTVNGTSLVGAGNLVVSGGTLMTAATAGAGGAAGTVPASAAGDQAKFLRADATWQAVPAAAVSMTGATAGAAGTAGLVPAPAAGDQAKVLSGAGTWITPTAAAAAMTGANGTTAGTAGTVPAPAATDNVNFLRGDGTWAAASGGAPVRASINVTANAQTGKLIVTGYGTSAQAALITATASGAGDIVTVNVPAGFLLKTASFNCPAGFNTGTAFTFTYKDPFSSTSDIGDAVLPSIWLYNGAYVIQTQTNILLSAAAGGMISIQKTGLTAATNYVWNLKVL